MAEEEKRWSSITVRTILESLSALAIASLLFGFLIVNAYLAPFGMWDFSFLRVDYVSAGVLFIVFLSLAAAPMVFAKEKIAELKAHREKSEVPWYKKFFIWVLEWLIAGSSVVLFIFFLDFILPPSDLKTGVIVMATFVTIILTLSARELIYALLKTRTSAQPSVKDTIRQWASSFHLFAIFLGVIGLTFIFGLFIYPLVPHFFGGGRPTMVQINFAGNNLGATSTKAYLVYETPDLVVYNTEGGTYSINASQVSSIQYLESIQAFRFYLPIFLYGKLSTK